MNKPGKDRSREQEVDELEKSTDQGAIAEEQRVEAESARNDKRLPS